MLEQQAQAHAAAAVEAAVMASFGAGLAADAVAPDHCYHQKQPNCQMYQLVPAAAVAAGMLVEPATAIGNAAGAAAELAIVAAAVAADDLLQWEVP